MAVKNEQKKTEVKGKTAKKETMSHCLVTGAAGFLGRNLVDDLLKKGCKVTAMVRKTPAKLTHKNLKYVTGDIRNKKDLIDACEGVDTVFHVAAVIALMGGSSVTEEYRKTAYDVNVTGTKNVIEACQKQGVARLIHTSSNIVCFNGAPVPNMNQNTPYASNFTDLYTETKVISEKDVLQANGKKGLLTCAFRPSGIYGPSENHMLDRFMDGLARGQMVAIIGNGNAVQDNTYIDNLVHAQTLAAQKLVPGSAVAGKAYFITDGEPKNHFEFFRPLIEGCGYPYPKIKVPVGAMKWPVSMWEHMHFRYGISEPIMTPKELEKVGTTNFSSNEDAFRDFGFVPVKTLSEAMRECVPYCVKKAAEIKKEIAARKTLTKSWKRFSFNTVIRAETVIDAPVGKVWSVLVDFENYPSWNPFTTSIKTNFKVGEKVDMMVAMTSKRSISQVEWIKAIEPERKMCWGMTLGAPFLLKAERCQILKSVKGSQTRYYTDDTFSGLLVPLIMLTHGKHVQRGFIKVAAALKAKVEAED